MNYRITQILSALALSSIFSIGPSVAATGTDLPPAERFGPVSVISGGVDLDEAALFKQSARRYPLRVVFSVRGGDYAVPDRFTILQKGRVIAELGAAGPWLLIDLPPGSYTLQAEFEGRQVERPVTVGPTGTTAGTTVQWVAPPSID